VERKRLEQELSKIGISNPQTIFYNLNRAELVEAALAKQEGKFSQAGAFVVNTSPYTGRSPNDKYLVTMVIQTCGLPAGHKPWMIRLMLR